jgi:hypothetical protein
MADAAGEVLVVERTVSDEGIPVVNVQVDPTGGANSTAEQVTPAGIDSLPLRGDIAGLADGTGSGGKQAIGYVDPKNPGKALEGETRLYSRASEDGAQSAEVWLHGNGDVEIKSVKSGGKIILNGVEIDQQGNLTAPGEVTAKATAAPVKLSTHLHGSGTGPTTGPTPGT